MRDSHGASYLICQVEREREMLEEHEARALLERGARWLGDLEVPRSIVVSASTGEGLAWLAEHEQVDIVVFGSDYRTPPGSVEPGASAQHLLEGGPVAVAVAPAGLRAHANGAISSVALFADETDAAAGETVEVLAAKLGAEKVATGERGAGLPVDGSQLCAPEGRITLRGSARPRLT